MQIPPPCSELWIQNSSEEQNLRFPSTVDFLFKIQKYDTEQLPIKC